MQAAPGPIARVLRPLCWMLALDLPPALARRKAISAAADAPPGPAAKPKPPRPGKPRAPPPPPPPWMVPPAPRGGLTLEYEFGRPRLVWS